jgi:hypothetical protein
MAIEPENFTAKTAKIAKSRQSRLGGIRRTAGSKFSELRLRVLPDHLFKYAEFLCVLRVLCG